MRKAPPQSRNGVDSELKPPISGCPESGVMSMKKGGEYSQSTSSSEVDSSYVSVKRGTGSDPSAGPRSGRGVKSFFRGAAQGVRETVFGLLPFLARVPRLGLLAVALV